MATKQDLKQTLHDVRVAHRFLGEFYARLLDIFKVVDQAFGLQPYYWKPRHHHLFPTSMEAQDGRWLPHRRWYWDALPLYNFSLFFTNAGGHPAKDEWMLEAWVELDSKFGTDSASDQGTQSGCPDPNKFDPVENAASRLHLAAFRCDSQGSNRPNWFQAWRGLPLCYEKQSEVQRLDNEQIGSFSAVTLYRLVEELGDPESVKQFCGDAKTLFNNKLDLNLSLEP